MKRAVILCFSPTGNTREVCNIINDVLKVRYSTTLCDVTLPRSREKFINQKLDGDLLIIATPVYCEMAEKTFVDFLKKISLSFEKAVAVCTYGYISAGAAISNINYVLKKKRIPVIAAAEIPARHYFAEAGIKELSGEKISDYSKEIADFTNKACDKNRTSVVKPKFRLCIAKLFPKNFMVHLPAYISKTNYERCTECSSCIRVCPSGAINKDFTTNNNACIGCAACVNVCKSKARNVIFRSFIPVLFLKHGIRNNIKKQIQPKFYL